MSIMSCKDCGTYIDTDEPELGVWVDEQGNPDPLDPSAILCDSCAEESFTPEQIEAYCNAQ